MSVTVDNLAAAFDQAAPQYDLMVALNPGYHAHLRSAADALVEALPTTSLGVDAALVDLGCGSGASTRALQRATEAAGVHPRVVGVDASAGMLQQAQSKAWPAGYTFRVGRAEDLAAARPEWGIGGRLPGALACYLFRNLADRDAVLAALFGELLDGGTLVVQEYAVAGSRRATAIWNAVCWLVVIPLSLLTSRRTRLYRYLWRSVLEFDSVQTFVDRLYRAGFVDVEVRTVRGWQRGILHSFRARKPCTGSAPAAP